MRTAVSARLLRGTTVLVAAAAMLLGAASAMADAVAADAVSVEAAAAQSVTAQALAAQAVAGESKAGGAPLSGQHRHRPPPLGVGAAFAPDGSLWVVGLDRDKRLMLQVSTDEGRSWGDPRPLDVGRDVVVADGESRPKIAFGPGGLVVVVYAKPLARAYSGEVRLLRSADGGKTFAPPVTVHHDRAEITHRFDAITFDDQGVLHTAWVDKRDQEAVLAKLRAASAQAPTPAMLNKAYRGAAIYRNESRDGGLTFGPDIKVADHSCECCRLALSPLPGGGAALLWRHVFEPNERDHAYAAWGRGEPSPIPAAPVRATQDRWAVDACPHHGPGMSPAAEGGWHAVWFGMRKGVGGVRYGRLDATGRPVARADAVKVIPDAAAEHADVVSIGQAVVVAWRSFDGQRTRVRAWVSQDSGRTFALRELAQAAGANDHPRLLSHQGRVWLVWRTEQQVQVQPVLLSAATPEPVGAAAAAAPAVSSQGR